jgi:hypothetical protein
MEERHIQPIVHLVPYGREVDEVIKRDKLHAYFWRRILFLNANLLIYEGCCRYLPVLKKSILNKFFEICQINILEYSIIGVYKLWGDPKSFTFRNLANFVKESVKTEFQAEIKSHLNHIRSKKKMFERDVYKRIEVIRHHQMAHSSLDIMTGERVWPQGTYYRGEEEQILELLQKSTVFFSDYFRILDFTEHSRESLFPPAFHPDSDINDVTRILDIVALKCRVVDLYNKEPARWEIEYKQLLSEEDIALIKEINERQQFEGNERFPSTL